MPSRGKIDLAPLMGIVLTALRVADRYTVTMGGHKVRIGVKDVDYKITAPD